ncbi:MAG: hypothetical protein ACR2KV_01595 [Solirubrobacteraceae bacterium]
MKIALGGELLADVRRYLSTTYIAGTELDADLEIVDANRPIGKEEYQAAWALLRLIDGAELQQGPGDLALELEDGPLEDMLLDTLATLERRGR